MSITPVSASASDQEVELAEVVDDLRLEDALGLFPTRVVSLPGDTSAFSFTMFQGPGMPDELFESQHQSLLREFENIRREFAA